MLGGLFKPHLGGNEKYLDIIGINYYVHNQWILNGKFIEPGHKRYKPFRQIITEAYERYKRPMFLAETGIEDEARPAWLRYVCGEVLAAMEAGIPVEGICLYPIVNHPGWVDDRHCYNGLWDYTDAEGNREIYEPLEGEIRRWQQVFDARDRDRISPRALAEAVGDEPVAATRRSHVTGPLPGCERTR